MTALLIAAWILCAFVTAVFLTRFKKKDEEQTEAEHVHLWLSASLLLWPAIPATLAVAALFERLTRLVLWLANIGRRK